MKDTSTRCRVAGFTLVETMLAISILSLVAVMSSRTLLDTTRSIHRMVFEKKTSLLVEMIFQQYTAYAAQNYQLLNIYNATNQQPKDFFNRPDNFGYDGILITTLATYSTNRSSCTVNVSLSWKDGGQTKTDAFVKTFAESAQIGNGAALQVWVKSPCTQGNTNDNIIAYCPGLAGFVLTATSNAGGTTVVGTTDATGQVLLKQVLASDNAAIQVSAPMVVDFNNASSTPSYYAPGVGGTYVAMLTKTVSLNSTQLNTLVVTDFQPAGQLTGQIINDDAGLPDPPVNNMAVTLGTGAIVAIGGAYQTCGTTLSCVVYSDANGKFTFNNVIPTPFIVTGAGRPGSAPQIQQTDTVNFQWGYSNAQPLSVQASDWSSPIQKNPITQGAVVSEIVHVQRLGWAVFNIINKITNLPFPNIVINAIVTPMAFQDTFWNSPAATSDSNGLVTFYNLFGTNNTESVTVGGGRVPKTGDYGAARSTQTYTLANAMGQANAITVPVMPGFQLTGQIVDINPVNGLAGMTFNQDFPFPGAAVTAKLDSNGRFTFNGFIPNADAASSIDQQLLLENYTNLSVYTIQGNTIDQATSAPAPHTTLEIHNTKGLMLFSSDANGFINITSTMPYYSRPEVTLTCDDNAMQCVVCPQGTPCPVSSVGSPITIDTRQNSVEFDAYSSAHGYIYSSISLVAYQGTPATTPPILCTLKDYAVQGSITNAAAQGIAGISAIDGNSNLVGTSADGTKGTTLGAYSGWAVVSGHTSTARGSISLSVSAQKGYLSASAGSIALPATVDPTVAITQNFQLSGTGTTSGGGF